MTSALLPAAPPPDSRQKSAHFDGVRRVLNMNIDQGASRCGAMQ